MEASSEARMSLPGKVRCMTVRFGNCDSRGMTVWNSHKVLVKVELFVVDEKSHSRPIRGERNFVIECPGRC